MLGLITPAFDHLISYFCLKYNLVNIHSLKTYVKNFGHDGTGINNKNNPSYQKVFNTINFAENLPQIRDVNKLPFR